ncbi:hypothetical protein KKC06_00465 [Patescibacteria group bacterium]|nr:hypothetical protein [Patescibacteria group bacterium]
MRSLMIIIMGLLLLGCNGTSGEQTEKTEAKVQETVAQWTPEQDSICTAAQEEADHFLPLLYAVAEKHSSPALCCGEYKVDILFNRLADPLTSPDNLECTYSYAKASCGTKGFYLSAKSKVLPDCSFSVDAKGVYKQ